MKVISLVFVALSVCLPSALRFDVGGAGGTTARYNLPAVDSLAESYGKGLLLQVVRSDEVEFDGTSATWTYEYVAAAETPPRTVYRFHSTDTTIAFDDTSALRIGAAAVAQEWCDSDVALDIAEHRGGSSFRIMYPDYSISAILGKPVVSKPTTYWYITYRSRKDRIRFFTLTIDASTREVTGKYSY
jgi:hypothetical protein